MKKLALFLCLIFFSQLFAHQQTVHQHIIREAYKLLLLSYPELQSTDLATFIGNAETNSNSIFNSWGDGTVASGGWIEDEYDIVYHYGIWNNPNFNQTLTPELSQIFFMTPETQRRSFVSITHFWDADGGLNKTTDLSDYALGIYWSYSCENAMQKILKYYYGDYENRNLAKDLMTWANCNNPPSFATDFSMKNLVDLYKQYGSIQIQGTQYFGLERWWETDCPNLYLQKKWIFEILGRMCHLLGDMSVPAHVHCNSHAGIYGMYSDVYENSVPSYHMWTANEIYSQGKTFINPYQNWNSPLYYLMYLMNQITDHYASGKTNGDNNYDSNCPGLSAIFPSLGLPITTTQINQTNLTSMHDIIFPYAIRATAGLLYWFATQTGLLRVQIPIYVNKAFEFDQSESQTQYGYIAEPTTISAPSSIVKNGKTYYFAGWSDDLYSPNPRTITATGSVTFTALYKVIHKSNDALAFSNNSQRRLIETKSGTTTWLHQVYTSSLGGVSHVWIEHSSNGGSSWVIGNNGKPLDDAAGGKNPSIAHTNFGSYNYNYIGVVWQQQYGSTYKIMGKMFNQDNVLSAIPAPVVGYPAILHTEPSDAYSVNANPNLVLNGGPLNPYFVTFERKTTGGGKLPGINWLVGKIESGSGQMAGSFGPVGGTSVVSGTDANTINTQMSQYPGSSDVAVNFIRQQGGKIYSHGLFLYPSGSNWAYYQINDGMISYDSPVNFSPSIVSLANNYYSACWIEYSTMVYYYFGNPSVRNYYGSSVQSSSINRGSGSSSSGFAVWSQGPSSWSNKSIRFDNGSPAGSSISTLSTSNKYVQVGNGAGSGLSNMYASSFNPLTSPYSFSTSGTLGPLSKENSEIVEERGFIINKEDASFRYSFGELNVDGKNIGFIDAPDALDYGKVEVLNNALVTEPFQINADSKIVFTEASGFADSAASKTALGKDGYITFKVELINEGTGRVIGTVKNENLTSSNVHAFQTPSYTLNITGLTGKTVRAKITLETNLIEPIEPSPIPDGIPIEILTARQSRKNLTNLILTKSYYDKNDKLPKSSLIELALDGSDIPLTYELAQNYPNPFNPSTVINYQIPENGMVTLKIYDILGKEVKILVNEQKTTGRYNVNFDASDLASGVYIYKLQVNDFVSSKKMLMIK